MTTIVVMPGGFHPFHAGHMSLYNSARRVFPDAEVFVAATNDTSSRPFPFAIKEKLAKLAGVEPGHFVQVKSPFRAEEITAKFDPNRDTLIFVRSEKDQGTQPKPGGVKKDGSPAYLQPLLGAKKLEPFAKHAYMAYLPTVEFGPGMTSATQIRTAWPTLDERRKTALVMSLYPATQKNPRLAATVVKLLDAAIGSEVAEDTDKLGYHTRVQKGKFLPSKYGEDEYNYLHDLMNSSGDGSGPMLVTVNDKRIAREIAAMYGADVEKTGLGTYRIVQRKGPAPVTNKPPELSTVNEFEHDVEENQGWAATFTNEAPVDERKQPEAIPAEYRRDPDLYKMRQYAKQHYGQYSDNPEMAMMKLLQRGLQHSEEQDSEHNRKLSALAKQIQSLRTEINQKQNPDYIEEKWSKKYKRSIDCSSPKGFSQRAHCAGRKK